MTRVVWHEITDFARRSLRRFCFSSKSGTCPGSPHFGHDASIMIEAQVPWLRVQVGDDWHYEYVSPDIYRGDPRWPAKCAHCDYAFTDADERQVFQDHLYRAPDGTMLTRRELPIGAMWNEPWNEIHRGADGLSVHVRCPDGHDWCVDARCSNCTRPDDWTHRCWVRHGNVRASEIHVDKNGDTCAAGAGSIDTGKWHGFLHNSTLTNA